MARFGKVLAFYQDHTAAKSALKSVKKGRFRRSALIQRTASGRLHIHNNFPDRLTFAFVGALIGLVVALLLHPTLHMHPHGNHFATLWVFTTVLGLGLGWLIESLIGYGVDHATIGRYKGWLIGTETLLIVKTDLAGINTVTGILRDATADRPITFEFYPNTLNSTKSEGIDVREESLTIERVSMQARTLAEGQTIGDVPSRTIHLRTKLRQAEAVFLHVRDHLTATARGEQPVELSAEWLLDNAYLIQSHIEGFRQNLPLGFYRKLPVLATGHEMGLPRTYSIAKELIGDTDAQLNHDNIEAFVAAYQSVNPLTIGELWALPLMMRLGLIEHLQALLQRIDTRQRERELADFWANRLLTAARSQPESMMTLIAQLTRELPDPSAHLAEQLLGHLYDESNVIAAVRGWLERKWNSPLSEVIAHEQRIQAIQQVSLANAVTSLRHLSQIDWRDVFESLSLVDVALGTDPADVYARMDFDTRDRCRHVIEQIARQTKTPELDVTWQVLEIAGHGKSALERHVGYHLLDAGLPAFERHYRYRPTVIQAFRRFIERRHTALYIGSILILTAVFTAMVVGWSDATDHSAWFGLALTAIPLIIVASELGMQIVNFTVTRIMPPRVLPKMNLEKGIPDDCRTLVVVPMMLLTPDSIRLEIERLEVRALANRDDNLRFALLADFSDAPDREMPDDMERLEVAVRGIERLNEIYGAGRFFFFHRHREQSETEMRWMGWERKRGKLEDLNRLLMNEPDAERHPMVVVGDTERLKGIRYIITLDADTQLPPETARKMIATLAHPLNAAVVSPDGKRVERGYTIIQPRVSTSLPSATSSLFSRLFTDPSGTDPYTHAVSDVYQDLSGEGSYHGKGIYDLAAFHRVLTNRFPDAHLLSHDLIEGNYVRVGLASDIELFDLFPADYVVYAGRQHRWTRGDWQIMDWVGPTVPTPGGGRERNPLTPLARWKIFDNLRRSLLPAACILVLLIGWLMPGRPDVWTNVVALTFLLPAIIQFFAQVVPAETVTPTLWQDLATTIVRGTVMISLLPHQAALSLDAIVRVLYRRSVSRKLLLEWETAHEAHQKSKNRLQQFLTGMLWIPIACVPITLLIAHEGVNTNEAHIALEAALPMLALWLFSPAIVARLCVSLWRPVSSLIPTPDRMLLRRIARQTWRFFDDFVGTETNWLPPDNYQALLNVEVAQRTSPTNIGLWLLSGLAARDFGYVSVDGLAAKLDGTMQTLDKLERVNGHFFNWYDTSNCTPLLPRYISMVDSGNFLGALWAFEQGLDELSQTRLIPQSVMSGIADTVELMRQSEAGDEHSTKVSDSVYNALEKLCDNAPTNLEGLVRRIRSLQKPAKNLTDGIRHNHKSGEPLYWASKLDTQVAEWNNVVDRYLHWVEILDSLPQEGLLPLGGEAHAWRRHALATIPSLFAIAHGQVPGLNSLSALAERAADMNLSPDLKNWLTSLHDASEQSRWLAGERVGQVERIGQLAHKFSEEMDMRFLYDEQRRVFVVGYNADERRLDNFYYDLLASEARLGSFVAIARGDVPVEHWFALGRPIAVSYGRRVMLSWSGTMFEYLMPLLLTRGYENSLIDNACRAAVECQIDYGRQRGVPWGISESGYSALDARQIYQYHAFGVPGLGLKRDLDSLLVVAPYATVMALMVDPASAIQNIKRLTRGDDPKRPADSAMRGQYGFYEAIDYSRRRDAGGDKGVIVRSYMAHHQGMSLLALDNVLNDNVMQDRFHADPRVRATESLLYEGVPTGKPTVNLEAISSARGQRVIPTVPTASLFKSADTATPRTQLLSNSNYSVMVTNAGAGYSHWKDIELTRWRADTTRDSYGTYCYIRDVDTGVQWSTAAHPMDRDNKDYSVQFALEKAEFRLRNQGIEAVTDIVVSPEDDVEIRRITLINTTGKVRTLDLTTYVELSLAPHNADRSHPAFSKLFVETESLPEFGGLIAHRRPRSSSDEIPWAFHLLAVPMEMMGKTEVETNRATFIGRGRTLASPIALDGPLSGSVGAVLDPIFSVRRRVKLQPGERIQVAQVLGAADNRDALLGLMTKYSDVATATRALELAWTHAQLDLRHLRIHSEDALQFQRLASHVLYPNDTLRPPEERLRQNHLGQSHLWAYGISGDLPLVVVTIGDQNDIDVVRQILMAHAYWRVRGLMVDLLILNEEATTYDQPLNTLLTGLIQTYSAVTGTEKPGGVFIRPARQIGPEDMVLLQTVARAVLVAARGPLDQQIGGLPRTKTVTAPFIKADGMADFATGPLPFQELDHFNGLGGFTKDGKEYSIYLGPGTTTPMPWINVIANPNFGALISESGSGYTWASNSQSNRLTPWSNDPVSDPVGDALYIRDEELGALWTPTPSPIREQEAYRARHGQGYSAFEHNSHGIEQSLTVTVPVDDNGGAPVRIQILRLRNKTNRARHLTVTAYAEWVLGGEREDAQMHVVTAYDQQSHALTARNAYTPNFGDKIAFLTASRPPVSYTGDRMEFLGRNGSYDSPDALNHVRLSGRTGAGLDPCGGYQVEVSIEPGREETVVFVLGQAANMDEVRRLVTQFRDPGRAASALESTKAWWDHTLSAVQVETPELSANLMLNRWLLYQDLCCRVWGRSAFYQSGGAFGFRDQLQDVMALVYSDPTVVREQIKLSAARQFREGDVQHWWHPASGAGVRTRITDDLLWLPFVTAQYIRVTGDDSILDEQASWLDAPVLGPDEHETFNTPSVTADTATILEHCRRAVAKGTTTGPHGLPLIGGGDWNDGLNRVGIGGKGESVWLAWFLIHVNRDFAEILRLRGANDEAKANEDAADNLAVLVNEQAWDGEWYRRAYFDDGTPLGSHESEEGKIDSLAQSWSVISGPLNRERAIQAMQSVEDHLVREDWKAVLLFTPAFDKTEHDPGYIKGYVPGVRENGGQYTHGSLWVPLAFARLGDGDRAVKLLRIMNPIEKSRLEADVQRYKVEPYVVAADVYALAGQEGRGGWTWYTGSASWMYRVWLEEVLGFTRRGDRLSVTPAIPKEWPSFTIRYRHGATPYEIRVDNASGAGSGVASLTLDGERHPEGSIPLIEDGKAHLVIVTLGATQGPQAAVVRPLAGVA